MKASDFSDPDIDYCEYNPYFDGETITPRLELGVKGSEVNLLITKEDVLRMAVFFEILHPEFNKLPTEYQRDILDLLAMKMLPWTHWKAA